MWQNNWTKISKDIENWLECVKLYSAIKTTGIADPK